jgi:holin-like protein
MAFSLEDALSRYLKQMLGLLILIAFHAAGVGLHHIGVPLPAGVLGLLLFLASLVMRVVKIEWVERTADLMVRHMLLLFVPLLAGLTAVGDVLRNNALALVASIVVSLVAVLLTTGGLAHLLLGDAGPPPGDEPVD